MKKELMVIEAGEDLDFWKHIIDDTGRSSRTKWPRGPFSLEGPRGTYEEVDDSGRRESALQRS